MPRRQRRGGASGLNPQPLDYTDGDAPAAQSLAQGRQFGEMTASFHGGAAAYPDSFDSVLPADLQESARVASTFQAFDEIKGLTDQAGGRRRRGRKSRKGRKGRKGRKTRGGKRSHVPGHVGRKSRKNYRKGGKRLGCLRKSRKANMRKTRKGGKRRGNRKSRVMYRRRRGGGLLPNVDYAGVNDPGMLLSKNMYQEAGLNPEWDLAADPNAFAPVQPRA